MSKISGFCLLMLVLSSPAIAQVVPAAETSAEAKTRIAAAMKAPDAKATSALISRFANWGDSVVVEIDAGDDREPVTVSIRAAHSALVREEKRGRLPADIVVNFRWAGLIMGSQFIHDGRFKRPLANMTAEQWFADMRYSGSSEKGMIGMVSWCRRGGASQAPPICLAIKKSAIERMLWNAAGG